MDYNKILEAWAAQADEYNLWEDLSEPEKIEFAAQYGEETALNAMKKATVRPWPLARRYQLLKLTHLLHEAQLINRGGGALGRIRRVIIDAEDLTDGDISQLELSFEDYLTRLAMGQG